MRKGAKLLLGTLVLTGGVGVSAMISAPANADSCFWHDLGQSGAKRCFTTNVQDFEGMKFSNGQLMSEAKSWENLNWVYNDYVYSGPNYTGIEQELEDETVGNFVAGIRGHLGSYDAR